MMQKVAILLTVHNRREKTLECLHDCYQQIDSMKGDDSYSFSVYLVDDGSTDGTSEAVMDMFPQTHIIKGDGSLFWNQGMRLAWKTAAEEGQDFYLWLNDDTIMKEGALSCIMETSLFLRHRAIVVGTAVNAQGKLSYGGRSRSGKIIAPDPVIPVPCYTFNGNLVLVPSHVYKVLGNLEERYRHGFGDYDYGVRAVKAKVVRVVAPGILCECDRNIGIPKWRNGSYPLKMRIKYLCGPKGRPPREQFLYDCRSQGILFAVMHAMSIFVKVLFPKKRQVNDSAKVK